jgi:hypothetical protein
VLRCATSKISISLECGSPRDKARCELLKTLREAGPVSIYELSKRLGRNYKNVHTDVLVSVPWDLLRAELGL